MTLIFADGVSKRLDVSVGTRLTDAAVAAGLNLLTDCSNGQCGTCTAQQVSGTIDMDDYDRSVLTDDDRAAGTILPCVCRIRGACAIEFPYDGTEAMGEEPAPVAGAVAGVEWVAAQTALLSIDMPEPVDFEPGQYVRIQPHGADFHRSYSMANTPGGRRLQFYVRQVSGGAFSQWLSQARTGERVEVSHPHGRFFLRDEPRPRLFVAGGTGVAPFLAMLRTIAARPVAGRTTLLIGARTPEHLFAMEELQALGRQLGQLDLRVALEHDPGPDCHRGYATDLIEGLGLEPSTRVYLCGPPPMVEAGRRAVQAAGLAASDVLCERFA